MGMTGLDVRNNETGDIEHILGQKELIDTAGREHLVLYQADIFQVPRLISLFGIQPTLTSLLVFKKGQLVDKKEV